MYIDSTLFCWRFGTRVINKIPVFTFPKENSFVFVFVLFVVVISLIKIYCLKKREVNVHCSYRNVRSLNITSNEIKTTSVKNKPVYKIIEVHTFKQNCSLTTKKPARGLSDIETNIMQLYAKLDFIHRDAIFHCR